MGRSSSTLRMKRPAGRSRVGARHSWTSGLRITTAEARRLFAAGEHAEALNLLEGFDPRNHEDVVRTFDELETRLRAIERQVQEYLADASAALSAT